MIFYCPNNTKHIVRKALENFGGEAKTYQFTKHGLTTWKI
jgi:D-glycero-alpha-D-manno-heptose-7-phosphate kinase